MNEKGCKLQMHLYFEKDAQLRPGSVHINIFVFHEVTISGHSGKFLLCVNLESENTTYVILTS